MIKISSVGVIGAGQMGSGIAQVSAQAGLKSILFDTVSSAIERAKADIPRRLDRAVEKGSLSKESAEKTIANLSYSQNMSDLANCDIVIEAIIENAEIKESVFQNLGKILKTDAIIASNTSSISITRLAKASGRPEQFIGMHFMNPVPIMKLIEIISGLQTSDATYQAALELTAKLDKQPVTAIDGPGFIVNRILCPMINEAIYILQEGAKAEDIDAAMQLGTNQPMGPLTLADFVGLDTLLAILELLHRELGEDKYRPCPLLRKYVEAGWYGKKSGRGFYSYEK